MGVPPVLDIALDELAARGPNEMLAGDVAPGDCQGHHVLELIAKAVGTPGLIESGAGPDAAAERLIEEPAVQHDVHGAVGSADLDGPEHVVPLGLDRVQREIEVRRPIGSKEGTGALGTRALRRSAGRALRRTLAHQSATLRGSSFGSGWRMASVH
jgi:hypothetical protein